MKLLLRLVSALLLLLFALWGAGAIYFRAPLSQDMKYAVMAAFGLVFLVAIRAVFRRGLRGPAFLAASLATLALLVWYSTVQPSDTLAWAPDVERRSLVSISGDRVSIKNLRNFAWTGPMGGAPEWQERQLKLSDIQTVDLLLSYWAGPAIAHMLVSFGTPEGQYYTFSTEIRRQLGQDYDPLAGFFRSYTLNTVVAEEADIVKVRTNFRDEDVYRYRLDVTPETARKLFVDYAALTQELERAPAFYNTLLDNCSTAPFRMVRRLDPEAIPFDWRIIAVGPLPNYLYAHRFIDTAKPLETIRREARVTDKARAASWRSGMDFSRAIREPSP